MSASPDRDMLHEAQTAVHGMSAQCEALRAVLQMHEVHLQKIGGGSLLQSVLGCINRVDAIVASFNERFAAHARHQREQRSAPVAAARTARRAAAASFFLSRLPADKVVSGDVGLAMLQFAVLGALTEQVSSPGQVLASWLDAASTAATECCSRPHPPLGADTAEHFIDAARRALEIL